MIQAIDGINAQKWVFLNLKLSFISDNFRDDISNPIIWKDCYFLPNKHSPSKLLIKSMRCKYGEKNHSKMCSGGHVKDQ